VLLHRGHVQPGRLGGQPEEVRRLHPRGEARLLHGRILGPHPGPADAARRVLPGGGGRAADHHHRLYWGLVELSLRWHGAADRGRRGAGHDEAARGAADDVQLRRFLEVVFHASRERTQSDSPWFVGSWKGYAGWAPA